MIFDEFDHLHADEETKAKTLAYVMKKQKKSPYRKSLFAFAITACLLFLFLFTSFHVYQEEKTNPLPAQTSISYVSVDINPSMEWAVNEEEIIVDVISYNEDVENLSFVSSLKGKTLIEGMNMMIQDEIFQEYMKDGFLEVGIYSEQKQQENQLQQQINGFLEKHLSSTKYHCSCPNKDTFERSRKQQMSFGKYGVIQEIQTYTNKYSEEELEEKSMRELHDILSSYDHRFQKGMHHGKQNGQNKGYKAKSSRK